jgi:GDP-mannose 6-dehydrogenase
MVPRIFFKEHFSFLQGEWMRLCVIGLGYVGTVTAACLAELGHEVMAWDARPERLRAMQNGLSTLAEPGVYALIRRGVTSGNLLLSALPQLEHHNLFFICVGTPLIDGHLNHEAVAEVLASIYEASASFGEEKIAVIRSTINIISLEQIILELNSKMPKARVGVVLNPEFLREASAVADFMAPPFIVVGGDVPDQTLEAVLAVYSQIPCRKFKVGSRTAGVLKLACNAFHATKVAFTNEVALACDLLGADAGEVFSIFRQDDALNCSDKYLRPGFAYGGSCLGKDLAELVNVLEMNGTPSPLLRGVAESNERVIVAACDRIVEKAVGGVTLIGITFKPGTGDLRDSPYLRLAAMLLEKGIHLQIYDPDLDEEGRTEVVARLASGPGSARLCSAPAEALVGAGAVALAKLPQGFDSVLEWITAHRMPVFDLERLLPAETALDGSSAA